MVTPCRTTTGQVLNPGYLWCKATVLPTAAITCLAILTKRVFHFKALVSISKKQSCNFYEYWKPSSVLHTAAREPVRTKRGRLTEKTKYS